jgi:hypothetical protein
MRRLAWPTRLFGVVASYEDDDEINWWLDRADQTRDEFYRAEACDMRPHRGHVHRILKWRRFKKRHQRLHTPLHQLLVRRQIATLCRGWQ